MLHNTPAKRCACHLLVAHAYPLHGLVSHVSGLVSAEPQMQDLGGEVTYLGCLLLHFEGSFCLVMSICMLYCFTLCTNDVALRGHPERCINRPYRDYSAQTIA